MRLAGGGKVFNRVLISSYESSLTALTAKLPRKLSCHLLQKSFPKLLAKGNLRKTSSRKVAVTQEVENLLIGKAWKTASKSI